MSRALTLPACAVLLLVSLPAAAQSLLSEDGESGGLGAGIVSMGALLSEGFQIMSSSPSGDGFVVFLQNGRQAYACEVDTVSASRCGEIE
jgi:hypothetical protein